MSSRRLIPCSSGRPRCPRSSAGAAARPRRRRPGSGAGARPGSRSSGRRTDCAGATERCTTGCRSSSSSASTISSTVETVRECSSAIVAHSESSLHERKISASDLHARLRERHLEVLRRACGRTASRGRDCAARRGRPLRTRCRSRTTPEAGTGSASTRTPTGSRAATRHSPPPSGRRARTRADIEQCQLVDRREGAEERRRTAGRRRATGTRAASVRRARRGAAHSRARPASGNAASSVAASADSRLPARGPAART